MTPISATTRGEAWFEALKALRAHDGLLYNLIVEISRPGAKSAINAAAQDRVDQMLVAAKQQPINTVAETIFPASEFIRHGSNGVYSVYPDEVYPAIHSLPANHWGTYAYRLLRRRDENGAIYRPLERVVEKLKGELNNFQPKRGIYELDAEGHGLSTYDPETDWNKYRGGQCLSHISIKLGPEREIYLTATYRYQYYIRKALGNFLGLARLQAFIAREVGTPVGPLVCHATLARLDTVPGVGGLRDIDALIDDLTQV